MSASSPRWRPLARDLSSCLPRRRAASGLASVARSTTEQHQLRGRLVLGAIKNLAIRSMRRQKPLLHPCTSRPPHLSEFHAPATRSAPTRRVAAKGQHRLTYSIAQAGRALGVPSEAVRTATAQGISRAVPLGKGQLATRASSQRAMPMLSRWRPPAPPRSIRSWLRSTLSPEWQLIQHRRSRASL